MMRWVSRGPSVASKLSSQFSPDPVLDKAPAVVRRILRRGSLAPYSWNLVVVGLYPSTLPGLKGCEKSLSSGALLTCVPAVSQLIVNQAAWASAPAHASLPPPPRPASPPTP